MIIVLGVKGQVGNDLIELLTLKGLEVRGFTREEADLTQTDDLVAKLAILKPTAVINAAAYTAVDLAEKEPDKAFQINATAPGFLARFCASKNIPFIHYSTDYVFSGIGDRPWTETDPTGPLSVYGKSKLAGEEAILAAGGKSLILRTSWVYSAYGKNFLNTMLRLAAEKDELKIVSDQVGVPTLSKHLAQATIDILLDKAPAMDHFPAGIFHVCNLGETTWYEFAREIFTLARSLGKELRVNQIIPIKTEEYPTPAKRPLNSRLSSLRLLDTFAIELPEWRVALKECMESRK
jgi:dTDP-4-dehydrorhamnose reductase